MNKELIEQIRNGKALHYDIDNVELLNEVLHKVKDTSWQASGRHKYYYLLDGYWDSTDGIKKNAIKLSDFLPNMISVAVVKDKLNEMINKSQSRIDQLTKHLNEYLEIHEHGLANNCDLKRKEHEIYFRELNKLLTFLNTQTNVK